MTSQIIPVEPFDLIMFGATGDLARRMLFPSLYFLDVDGLLPPNLRIVGAARSGHTDDRKGRENQFC